MDACHHSPWQGLLSSMDVKEEQTQYQNVLPDEPALQGQILLRQVLLQEIDGHLHIHSVITIH